MRTVRTGTIGAKWIALRESLLVWGSLLLIILTVACLAPLIYPIGWYFERQDARAGHRWYGEDV